MPATMRKHLLTVCKGTAHDEQYIDNLRYLHHQEFT